MRNEELGMKVAASPQSINRAMPEGGIQVTSHQSLVTPNPQSLIPSHLFLLSNFLFRSMKSSRIGGSFFMSTSSGVSGL